MLPQAIFYGKKTTLKFLNTNKWEGWHCFDMFAEVFNVWLNRRSQLAGFSYLPLQPVCYNATCQEAAGKLHCALVKEKEEQRQITSQHYHENHFDFVLLSLPSPRPPECPGHTWRTSPGVGRGKAMREGLVLSALDLTKGLKDFKLRNI